MTARTSVSAMGEAIFGSAARGDLDRLSDRDYLIVDDDIAILRRRAQSLAAEGWSVASYTFKKLEALSNKGALFVQHLKDESLITEDSHGRLRALLSEFRPKSSYSEEILQNSVLARLIEHRPIGGAGALWAADVLYVSLRNYGILKLAERGAYHFSFRSVIEELQNSGIIDGVSSSDFLALRFCKTLYRADESSSSERVGDIITRVLFHLKRNPFPCYSKPVVPENVLKSILAESFDGNSYARLRAIEKGMIAAHQLNSAYFDSELQCKVQTWIRNPRSYAFAASGFDFSQFVEIISTQSKAARHVR